MATILIVDDDPNCRKPLSTLLRCEGYLVTEASNGLEGLQKLREKRHDLVVLDMMMPGLDGVTVLQAIRREWAKLPVLMVTHEHNTRMLDLARQIGFQEYIFKGDCPFSRMLELVKRNLGEHFVPRRRGRKPKHRPETLAPMAKPTPPKPRYTEFQMRLLRDTLKD